MEPIPQPPPRPDRAALFASGLTKRFGKRVAVDALELTVPAGSFFGLVGPNGAGKTTTLRMVTGLLRPDGGTAYVDDLDVWREPVAVKARIGVVPEDLKLFERLTGRELLTYNGLLRGMEPGVVQTRAEDLLRVLGIADAGDTLLVDYSHGMKRKAALAAALLHAPRVLFLDEPFEAIDPVSAKAIRAVLERHVDAGATVIFSSHVMDVVQRLCDRVAVMDRGRIVASGTVDEVRGEETLEDAFVRLVGGESEDQGGLHWLDTSSA